MANHYSVWTVTDYSEESSPLKVYNGAITAVSIGGFLTDFGALRTATQALVLGTVSDEMWVGDKTMLSNSIPTDPDAQRERKALVTYEGNTSHKLFTCTIPAVRTKDGSNNSLLLAGTDLFDLAAPLVSAWVTAFETLGRTPDSDTETVTVRSIRLVGRNI